MNGTISLLLVDDDELFTEVFAGYLRRRGFAVTPSTSGRDAIEKLQQRPWDVVLADMLMPVIDGFDVCREARRQLPRPAVVMISGHDGAGAREAALAFGADDFSYKREPLPDIVRKVNAAAQARRELAAQSTMADGSGGAVAATTESPPPERPAWFRQMSQAKWKPPPLAVCARGRGHVLLVDPDAHDRKCVAEVLSARGFGVTSVPDASQLFEGPELVWLRAGEHALESFERLQSLGYDRPVLLAGTCDAPRIFAEQVRFVEFPRRQELIELAILDALPESRRSERPFEDPHGLRADAGALRAALTKTEASLFDLFVAEPGKTLTRNDLEERGLHAKPGTITSLDRHVSALRDKLRLFDLEIHAHKGTGYSFVP